MLDDRRIGHNFRQNVGNVMVGFDFEDCYCSDRNLMLDPKVPGLDVALLAQTLSTGKSLSCVTV